MAREFKFKCGPQSAANMAFEGEEHEPFTGDGGAAGARDFDDGARDCEDEYDEDDGDDDEDSAEEFREDDGREAGRRKKVRSATAEPKDKKGAVARKPRAGKKDAGAKKCKLPDPATTVREYLCAMNRPYSAAVLLENLHREVPLAKLKKILEEQTASGSLCEAGETQK